MPNHRLTALLVFILSTTFYTLTLLPSLAWGDGTKLQSEAISGESFVLAEMSRQEFSPDPFMFSRVGVAAWDHPLYIILGHLLVRLLPFIDPLWLVNFISALFGAGSVALVFLICHRHTGSIPASGYAAFALAVSHTFWWHSSTPEVYTLFVFLLLLSIYFFDQFERSRAYGLLFPSGLFLGLAASNHILAFLAIPALILYYFLWRRVRAPRRLPFRNLLYTFPGFLTGYLVYLIQFARMSRNFPPGEIMGPAIGTTFLGNLGSMMSPFLLGKGLLTFFVLLSAQFSVLGVILGVYGIYQAFARRDLLLQKLVAFLVVFAGFGILYQVADQFAFFLTSYVFWAIMMGVGAKYLFSRLRGRVRPVLAGTLVLIVVGTPLLYATLPGLAKQAGLDDTSAGVPEIGTGLRDGLAYYVNPNKRGEKGAYQFGTQTLAGLAPNAVVLAGWYTDTDEYFVLRYFVTLRGMREDVMVVGWPTQDPFTFDSKLAIDLIEKSISNRPVYLASLSEQFYGASTLMQNYCIVPESNLYRLYPIDAAEDRTRQCLHPPEG